MPARSIAGGGHDRVNSPISQVNAQFGQIPMSPILAATLSRAYDVAAGAGAPEVSLEHVLLALCDDVEAVAVLDASRVAIDQLYSEVVGYLNQTHVPNQGDGVPKASADVSRIIEAAAAAARGGRRRDITGAIVLAAIVGDGRSVAAQILQALGLTFDEAIKALQRALNQPGVRDTPVELPPAEDVLARARERVQLRSAPTLREIMNEPLQRSAPPPMRQLAPPSVSKVVASDVLDEPRRNVPVHDEVSGHQSDLLDAPRSETAESISVESEPTEPSPYVDAQVNFNSQVSDVLDAASSDATTDSTSHKPDVPHEQDTASVNVQAESHIFDQSDISHVDSDQNFQTPREEKGAAFYRDQNVAPLDYGEHQPTFPLPMSRPSLHVPHRDARGSFPQAEAVPHPDLVPDHKSISDGPYGGRTEPTFDIPRPVPVQPPPLPGSLGAAPTGNLSGLFSPDTRNAMPPPNIPQHPNINSAPITPPYPSLPGVSMGLPDPFPPRPSHREYAGSGALPFPQALPPGVRFPGAFPTASPAAPESGGGIMPYPNLDAQIGIDQRQPATGTAGAASKLKNDKSLNRAQTFETGQLAENIPRAMRIAKTERVEIRIAKADILAMTGGLDGAGQVFTHGIAVTPAMSVRLRAPDGGFFIETASPETQWIDNRTGLSTDDFASWRFLVTPNERGWSQLQIVVSARTMGADGIAADTELPEQIVDIKVRTNLKQSFSRLVGWTVAALIGGVLARFGEASFDTAQLIFQRVSN